MKETVLLFHFDKETERKAKMALLPLKIRVKTITPDQYHLPVGELAGLDGIPAVEGAAASEEEFDEPMMIMAWLGSSGIDQVLSAFRRQGIGRINYKAIVTEQNQYWDCRSLYEELKKEHAMMAKQR